MTEISSPNKTSLVISSGNGLPDRCIEVVELSELDIANGMIDQLGTAIATATVVEATHGGGDQNTGEEMYDIEVEMDDFFHVIHNVHDSTLQVSLR